MAAKISNMSSNHDQETLLTTHQAIIKVIINSQTRGLDIKPRALTISPRHDQESGRARATISDSSCRPWYVNVVRCHFFNEVNHGLISFKAFFFVIITLDGSEKGSFGDGGDGLVETPTHVVTL